MAKFLDSSMTAHFLGDLIASAREKLVLTSPQLKFSGRTKELLAEKAGVDLHVVFAHCELVPQELDWLRAHPFIHTHYCRSLTARCYLSEELCIITSMDLFDFGQVLNDEAGVLVSRTEDPDVYREAAEQMQQILSASEEMRLRVERAEAFTAVAANEHLSSAGKLSTHRLAKKLGLKTHELLDGLQRLGAIEIASGQKQLTARGMKLGGEFRSSARFGNYFVWPENFELQELAANSAASREAALIA